MMQQNHTNGRLTDRERTPVRLIVLRVLFTLFAFYGIYDWGTLLSVALSSYVIFIFTSLLDTPVVYAARWLHERKGAAGSCCREKESK